MADNFTRVARVLAIAHAKSISLTQAAERLYRHDAMLAAVLRGAVDPIDRNSALLAPQVVTAEHVQAVRPLTILGKLLPFARRVPFTTPLAYLTAGTSMQFVGERVPIHVRKPTFGSNITLPRLKVAGLTVMSNELLESSRGEEILGQDLRAAEVEATDRLVFDPTLAPIDLVQPASLTYGVAPLDVTGAATAEEVDEVIAQLLAELATLGSTLERVHLIVSTQIAIALAFMRDTLGNRAFPTVSATGGSIAGLPLLVSASAPAETIIAIDATEMLVADDDEAEVSTSRFAFLDMDDAPAGSNRVSMFQTESTAVKLIRWINWSMRRPFIVWASNFAPPAPTWSAT